MLHVTLIEACLILFVIFVSGENQRSYPEVFVNSKDLSMYLQQYGGVLTQRKLSLMPFPGLHWFYWILNM